MNSINAYIPKIILASENAQLRHKLWSSPLTLTDNTVAKLFSLNYCILSKKGYTVLLLET